MTTSRRPNVSRSRVSIALLFVAACGQRGIENSSLESAPDAAPDARAFTVDMFDDFEDGDRDILRAGGRFGHWWNYGDGTEGTSSIAAVALDPASERHVTYGTESTMALRVQANGYAQWGSGYAADVNGSAAYDVSAYTGLVLWARNLAPQPASIRVVIQDVNSEPAAGVCDSSPDAPAETACYDAFGQDLDLVTGWQRYHLPFWSLKQLGFGLKVPGGLATDRIFKIAFIGHAGVSYDYYVDDVGFYAE